MVCKSCSGQLTEGTTVCPYCGAQTTPPTPNPESADYLKMVFPVGRSGFAIAAGYLGLCSVTFVLAPFAVVFGLLALFDIKKHPKKRGRGRAWFGIVLGTIFTIFPFVIRLVSARS